MNEYKDALETITTYLNSLTDRTKAYKHHEFREEGFKGTRHRLREPYEEYMSLSQNPSEVSNNQIEALLVKLTGEAIILLSEYLRQDSLALKVITFSNEEDAKKLLAILKSQINTRGFVSVSMYYAFCGIEATTGQNFLVWTDLSSVRVMHIADTYFLDLPKPVEMQIGR